MSNSELLDGLVGESPLMVRLKADLLQVGTRRRRLVLLQGPRGSGKELVAAIIHELMLGSSTPLVAVNCASLDDPLADSELFGHRKGAFSGAEQEKIGLFQAAHGGAIFLDEIGELSSRVQAKLLRVLERAAVRPVGAIRETQVDVVVLAATNDDLESSVRNGTFRRDLFDRLNALVLDLPPLRDRGRDVLLLADHFVRQAARESAEASRSVSSEASELMLAYPWPGNVRELKHVVEKIYAFGGSGEIAAREIRRHLSKEANCRPVAAEEPSLSGDDQVSRERGRILRVLEECDFNVTLAAARLGMTRQNLHRRMKKGNITRRIVLGAE